MERRCGYHSTSRAVLAFFVTLLLIAGVRIAKAAPDPCWEKHTYHVRFDTLGVSRENWRQLAGDELAAAVRWWNLQGQPTDGEWQTFVIANLPGGGGRLLIGRTAEQGCIHAVVSPDQWLKVRLQMLGLPV